MIHKFRFTEKEVDEALQLLHTRAEIVAISPLSQNVSSDPDDDHIIATAIAAGGDCIISGDKDLLSLKEFQKIKIIRPADFWRFEATSD